MGVCPLAPGAAALGVGYKMYKLANLRIVLVRVHSCARRLAPFSMLFSPTLDHQHVHCH